MNGVYILPIAFNFIQWLKDNLLSPLIGYIAEIFVKLFISFFTAFLNALLVALASLLYKIYSSVLMLLDMIQTIFDLLSGTEEAFYSIQSTGESGKAYLAELILQSNSVVSAFKNIWILCVVLCFVFVIAAVMRSISDLSGRGESVNDVIKNSFKTFCMFMIIQIFAFGALKISDVVLTTVQKGLNYAIGSTEDVRMANAIFAVSAINAGISDDASENAQTVLDQITGRVSYNVSWDKVKDFYSGDAKFWDITDVSSRIIISKIDYLSGCICLWFVLRYMAGSILVFVRRLIGVVVLFVISPFFVALTPLDGGARFERWKEHFIGYCFSTFSVIITVRVYMMLVPLFVSTNLIYNGEDILAYMIRLFSVAMLSMAFEKTGGIINRIMADADIADSSRAFAELQGIAGDIKKLGEAAKSGAGKK